MPTIGRPRRRGIPPTKWAPPAQGVLASVFAAEAVNEAAIAFGRALGGCAEIERSEKFALLGGQAAGLFALFGLAVEGLRDGCRAALLAEGENLQVELAGLVSDVEFVADADLAGRLGGSGVREDAVHVAGFRGQLAGLEEAGGPKPLVDAGAGHGSIFLHCDCYIERTMRAGR